MPTITVTVRVISAASARSSVQGTISAARPKEAWARRATAGAASGRSMRRPRIRDHAARSG